MMMTMGFYAICYVVMVMVMVMVMGYEGCIMVIWNHGISELFFFCLFVYCWLEPYPPSQKLCRL